MPLPSTSLVVRAYVMFRRPVAVFLAILLAGTAGYWWISDGKATFTDSLYMTFITVATIGYGEIVDLSASPGGRVFTMVIATVGIGSVAYMTAKLTAFIVESDISEVLRRRKMQDQIDALNGHYIICGIGRVGSNVAQELSVTERPFVAIEEMPEAIAAFRERHPDALYLHGDTSDEDLLRKAGIARAAGVFAVTGDDAKNFMVTLTAKELNPKVRIVARCHEVRNGEKLKRVGADATVSPDFTGGMRIASSMIRPTVVGFLDTMLRSDDKLRVEEVSVPEGFAPRPLGQAAPPSRDYVLLAVRAGASWEFNPSAEFVLQPGHAIVIMAHPDGRQALERAMAGG